jgi:flagellar hook-associated protein 1 FlgK
MSLQGTISIAASGLANVNRQLSVVSQNVANAGTAGYARETAASASLTSGGIGYGVTTGPAQRETDSALEAALLAQGAEVSALQVKSDALAAVGQAQGTTGAGDDLASRLGALNDAFTTLDADPSNQTNQAAVVSAASGLAGSIRTQAASYASARQTAQDSAVTEVTALNTAVQAIGDLSVKIIAATARGDSTADLEGQRAAQEQTAAQLGGLRFLPQANGDVTAVAGGGLIVDTKAKTGPFSLAAAALGSGSSAPPLLLSGVDVTAALNGGSIGAQLALRDTILPQAQAGLDEFAETLSTRLSNQGLSLFTDPAGAVPSSSGVPVQSGYVGYSSTITVNPSVVSNPMLVRDGTQAVAAGMGGASAFTPNPTGGPAGFTTLIDRVLQFGFGAQAQANVAQPTPATTGLGANGSITLPYTAGTTLASFAANLVGSQAQQAGDAANTLSTAQGLQATLQAKLQSETGVSVDTELSNMVMLQNAYGANAKILTAAQSMWTDLLNAVTP